MRWLSSLARPTASLLGVMLVLAACGSSGGGPGGLPADTQSTATPNDPAALEQALNGATNAAIVDHLRLNHPADLELITTVWAAGAGRWTVNEYTVSSASSIGAELSNGLATYQLVVSGIPGSTEARVSIYKTADRRNAPIATLSEWEDDASTRPFAVSSHTFHVSEGRCRATHSFGGDLSDALPLASVSKLLVGAVVAGESDLNLGEYLVINDAVRSLPSGSWHELPDGSTRTTADALAAMWNASDNTAADLLVTHAGSERIHQVAVDRFGYQPNLPFLTTSELFKLKWGRDDTVAEGFIDATSLEERRSLLETIADDPLPVLTGAEPPTYNQTIEWKASPVGVCEAIRAIWASPTVRPIAQQSLGVGQGTLLDPAWFVKYGSEPGVFTAAGIHDSGAEPVVIVFTAVDPTSTIDVVEVQRVFAEYARLVREFPS